MTERFERRAVLVVVQVRVLGRLGERLVRLAVDTGATWTVIGQDILVQVGLDPASAQRRVRIVTAEGFRSVPMLRVDRLTAFDSERRSFAVLCHTVPLASGVDGLLGLDFFRDRRLTIDFRAGEITLE